MPGRTRSRKRGRTSRASFAWACATGGACATAVFTWIAFAGKADPLASETLGSVYDAQARSLLHGHWDVPAFALGFERFNVGGKFYAYDPRDR